MTLSDLAALGSFVSGIAVLASLGFLFFQMRQMTEQMRQTDKNQRAAMQLGRATRGTDLYTRLIDPEVANVCRKAWTSSEALSGTELFVWLFYANAAFFNWEDTFLQYRAGLLDEASMESEETLIRSSMIVPAWRAVWQFSRGRSGHAFTQYIDRIISEVPLMQPGDIDPLYQALYSDLLSKALSVSPGTPEQMMAEYQSLSSKKL